MSHQFGAKFQIAGLDIIDALKNRIKHIDCDIGVFSHQLQHCLLIPANERMDRRYELKRRGYGIEKLEGRVLEIYGIDRDELYSKSRQKARADARSVFCYWAVRELGVAGTQMAKRLGMSQPGVAYAVNKGERIVRDENLRMAP